MNISKVVQPDSRVQIHFCLSLESGFVVEDTYEDEPLELSIGSGALIEGLERAIIGMSPGEKKTVTLDAPDAFGPRDEDRIMEMDKSDFPAELAIEKGKIIGFTAPSGEEVAGAVLEVGEAVLVDFNHPLAGKRVIFDVELVSLM
ncbi:MAG: FKBP-type peptidyl-prolyl cis-trans isomerase [Gammaproteobacteria bacterium]|nr:FKBP-type peptidyl-prolyl cis-trans isomerase [Gammaproteobacteria bacterium]